MKTKTREYPFCACARTPAEHERRSAFTLVELLVVIAIIGILAAIIFPITAKVRSSARASHCLSNLRQVGSSFYLYAQENRQKYPPPQNAATSDYWFEALQPYAGTEVDMVSIDRNRLSAVFLCPEWKMHETEWAGGDSDIGYAMSAALTGQTAIDQPVTVDHIGNPSQTLLVVENPSMTTPYFPFAPGMDLEEVVSQFYDLPENVVKGTGRHGHRANYLFADGHVKGFTVEEAQIFFKDES